MARSFQQQSLTRKLVYLSLIVVLFFVTLVLKKQVVTAKAEELGLREKNQGEVELTGSALRLTLTGSRGLVVCYLWNESLDMQMKHEVNRLDLLIRALTKLQPHFVTPWLFQSWTLAYNISRDAQNLPDKYYYIASGTQLLAEGIRQNQEIPELRYNVGIYYRDKIGQSDDNLALQSFVQMSCIDPVERDPARFRPNPNNRRDLDWVQLQRFCEAHPFLIRRLYDGLGRKTPQEVIDFLEANQKIVSRFAETSEGGVSPLRPPAERYPILPATPPQPPFEQELTNDSELRDDFTGYTALRAWWSYAQDPLSLPHFRPPPGALVIFQQGPARAQAYIGEQLEEEGWFDETPWPIADWFPEDPLQPEGPKQTVPIGDPHRHWSEDAWERAYQMFYDHGRRHHLLPLSRGEEETLDANTVQEFQFERRVTNFDHFLFKADVERTRPAVTAHKRFFEAEQIRLNGDPGYQVLARYEDPGAFGPPGTWTRDQATGWTRIYYDHPQLRADNLIQESTYETQLKYLDVVAEVRGPALKELRLALARAGARPENRALWLPALRLSPASAPAFQGPFDGVDEHGQPLVSPESKRVVRYHRGEMQKAQGGSAPKS